MAGILGTFGRLWSAVRRPFAAAAASPAGDGGSGFIRGRYDAAQTTSENAAHWQWADGLSAAAAASPGVRARLRNRARYERDNNSHCQGIVLTLAYDLIGTGPRLQVRSKIPRLNRWLEREFAKWARAVGLGPKLLTMRMSEIVDGESFGELVTNPKLAGPDGKPIPVKLDVRPVEADQVATPDLSPLEPNAVDGIKFEGYTPVEYHRLRYHPGDCWADQSYDRIPASRMLHLFRADRPGQVRGISQLTPGLPLYSQLRRHGLAVLSSAEIAADHAAVIYTDSPAMDRSNVPNLNPDEGLPMERRMFQIMPYGWRVEQLKAEQPTTSFGEFRSSVLTEAGHGVMAPRNVATGDSSSYNYASGRLDRQAFNKSKGVDRLRYETGGCDPIFAAWLYEAQLIEGYLPDEFWVVDELHAEWQWDGDEHVDPTKEASANKTDLEAGNTRRGLIYARKGLDVDAEDERAAAEFGVSVQEYRRALFKKTFATGQDAAGKKPGDQDDEDEEEDEDEKQGKDANAKKKAKQAA